MKNNLIWFISIPSKGILILIGMNRWFCIQLKKIEVLRHMERDADIGSSFQIISFFQLTTSLHSYHLDKTHFKSQLKINWNIPKQFW